MRAIKKLPLKPGIITIRKKPGQKARAILSLGSLNIQAAIGRSGRITNKREGDGATPMGSLRLIKGYYRADRVRNLSTALPMRPIRPNMLWCDAPNHASYNRLVSMPLAQSHERLFRDDALYDICLVMDWNISSRRRNGGSAIFFHLARPGYLPTEGCIAVKLGDMKRLLRLMKKSTVVRIL